jgi:hypothetical protein
VGPHLRLGELAHGAAKDHLLFGWPEVHSCDYRRPVAETGHGRGTKLTKITKTNSFFVIFVTFVIFVPQPSAVSMILVRCVMHRFCLLTSASCLLLLLSVVPASADLTAFIGRATTPVNRPVKGVAIGTGLLIVGFEFEYADTGEDLTSSSGVGPAVRTFMFNGLLQTPVPIARTQFYGTLGGGVYRETLSTEPNDDRMNFGTNVGGGAKITLAGPIRLRLDYRVYSFRGTPRHTNVQRVYAGINLKF